MRGGFNLIHTRCYGHAILVNQKYYIRLLLFGDLQIAYVNLTYTHHVNTVKGTINGQWCESSQCDLLHG